MPASVAVADVPGAIGALRAGGVPLSEPFAMLTLPLHLFEIGRHRLLTSGVVGGSIVENELSVVSGLHWFV